MLMPHSSRSSRELPAARGPASADDEMQVDAGSHEFDHDTVIEVEDSDNKVEVEFDDGEKVEVEVGQLWGGDGAFLDAEQGGSGFAGGILY